MAAQRMFKVRSNKAAWIRKAKQGNGINTRTELSSKVSKDVVSNATINRMGIDTAGVYKGSDGTEYEYIKIIEADGWVRERKFQLLNYKAL